MRFAVRCASCERPPFFEDFLSVRIREQFIFGFASSFHKKSFFLLIFFLFVTTFNWHWLYSKTRFGWIICSFLCSSSHNITLNITHNTNINPKSIRQKGYGLRDTSWLHWKMRWLQIMHKCAMVLDSIVSSNYNTNY